MYTFSKDKKKESCQHESYCAFSDNICLESGFQEICRMKDTDINNMPLLKKVKDRVDRDNTRKNK